MQSKRVTEETFSVHVRRRISRLNILQVYEKRGAGDRTKARSNTKKMARSSSEYQKELDHSNQVTSISLSHADMPGLRSNLSALSEHSLHHIHIVLND